MFIEKMNACLLITGTIKNGIFVYLARHRPQLGHSWSTVEGQLGHRWGKSLLGVQSIVGRHHKGRVRATPILKYLNYSENYYKKTDEYFSIIIFAMSIE